MAHDASAKNLRILIVRCDRLGDVILSTPVFEVVKRHYPHASVTVMVRSPVVPVVQGLPSVDEVLVYDPDGVHKGIRGLLRLHADIRRGRFRIAVVLQSQWRIAAAIFFANIRYRVGPLSKLHSFLFYNRGARQSRSQVEMHEADYNLQLLRRLGIRVGTRNVPVRAHVSDTARARARQWLEARGWDSSQPLIGVHPGMGGSALNWPEQHYAEFTRSLLKEGKQVLLTGGPGEGALIERIRENLGPHKDKVLSYAGPAVGPVDELGALFGFCNLVVAPSTGPLHLALALGRPVLTFYPPIRVQSVVRWGPYLNDESRAGILVPEVYCGQEFSCRGNLCNYFPCMKGVTVAQALEQAAWQLGQAERDHKK